MGLKPLDTKAWVEPDALFPQYFDNKCRLFAHDAQACFAETQGSRLAQEECAERLLVYLCEQHGQLYRRDEHELHIEGLADGLSLAGDAPPLMRAGFWLQDDICLLEQRAGRHVLIAASLCAPSSWYLQEKIGLPLAGIHEPVPGLNAQIGRQIENVLERLVPLRPMQRFNWTVTDCNRLAKLDTLAAASAAIGTSASGLYLRVERQALVRLPRSNAIAFTIRVYIYPLEQLLPIDGAIAGLKAAVDAMSPAEVEYKSLLDVYPRLRQFAQQHV